MNIKAWIGALRPKTLTAALVPILVASCYSYYLGSFSLDLSLYALFAAIFIQIATNLFNDAIDFKKGADEQRVGPQRITQSGEASYKTVMLIAILFLVLAVLSGIPLVMRGGIDIFYIGVFSLVFAYAYTGGPFPLAYLGIADIFVVLFFGIIAVGGLCFLHTGVWDLSYLFLGIQVGLLCNIMLAINNLRDYKTDRLVNKNTLVARFGERFGRVEVLLLFFVPFSFSIVWLTGSMYFTALLPFMALPFAVFVCYRFLKTEVGPGLNKYLGLGSLYYLVFGALLGIGMVLDYGGI